VRKKRKRERERDGRGVEKGDEKERGDDWVGEREGQCRRRKRVEKILKRQK